MHCFSGSGYVVLRRQGREKSAAFLFCQLSTSISVAACVKVNACWVHVQTPQNAQGSLGASLTNEGYRPVWKLKTKIL